MRLPALPLQPSHRIRFARASGRTRYCRRRELFGRSAVARENVPQQISRVPVQVLSQYGDGIRMEAALKPEDGRLLRQSAGCSMLDSKKPGLLKDSESIDHPRPHCQQR